MQFTVIEPSLLRMRTVNPPTGEFEPVHVHPLQESAATVIEGRLTFVVAGDERTVHEGESITIPTGVPHTFAGTGGHPAVALQEFRPALRIAEFFEEYFALANRGQLDDRGMPSLLRLAVLTQAFSDEIRAVSPPWPVQRAAFAVLAPIARAATRPRDGRRPS